MALEFESFETEIATEAGMTAGPSLARLQVPGGWLAILTGQTGISSTFVPDPTHSWHIPRPISLAEQAKDLAILVARGRSTAELLADQRGVATAGAEVARLFDAFASACRPLQEAIPGDEPRIEKVERRIGIVLFGHTLDVLWDLQYGNSLEGATLDARILSGSHSLASAGRAGQVSSDRRFEFAISAAGVHGWREAREEGGFHTSGELAEILLASLMVAVEERMTA